MGSITKETCYRIWMCYREIEVGKRLLEDIEKRLRDGDEPTPLNPQDSHSVYTFGIPNGKDSYRMLNVDPRLARSVIKAQIAEKEKELIIVTEEARIELG